MTVSMVKGQRISLEKPGGTLSMVRMGLGWDAVKKKGFFGSRQRDIDLDASCVLFADGALADVVFFGKLVSDDGSVRHTGDNLTGAGDGDDESVIVDLRRLPVHVTSLVFTVSSFNGQTFNEVENAFCRVVNEADGGEMARYTLTGGGAHTAMVMSRIYRHGDGWKMNAIGEPCHGRTFQDMLPVIANHA
ncbi:tellurium resistance protein TerZ [Actinomadura pelletieri DSM 43383]|uniref:Tellurium resistance protein TerZ n=1 Tax=Actinomadura pelletieri DSM 43383 TaxID=1120940 RepID=A0A495QU14_9ACTN|nr:TerD family protein [Actinomadura pelletieri]RKS76931.1 tellurium resistance protein TerZ [Actinomadura pelletieri DSM 43383]